MNDALNAPMMAPADIEARSMAIIDEELRQHGIVLDPFAGLGSTLIACEQSGRICRAIESDPLHCDLIVRRWEQFTGEQAERAA